MSKPSTSSSSRRMRLAIALLFILGIMPILMAISPFGVSYGRFSPYNSDYDGLSVVYNELSNSFHTSGVDSGAPKYAINTSISSMNILNRLNASGVTIIMGPASNFDFSETLSMLFYLIGGGSLIIVDDFGTGNDILDPIFDMLENWDKIAEEMDLDVPTMSSLFTGGESEAAGVGDINIFSMIGDVLRRFGFNSSAILMDAGSNDGNPARPLITDIDHSGAMGITFTEGVNKVQLEYSTCISLKIRHTVYEEDGETPVYADPKSKSLDFDIPPIGGNESDSKSTTMKFTTLDTKLNITADIFEGNAELIVTKVDGNTSSSIHSGTISNGQTIQLTLDKAGTYEIGVVNPSFSNYLRGELDISYSGHLTRDDWQPLTKISISEVLGSDLYEGNDISFSFFPLYSSTSSWLETDMKSAQDGTAEPNVEDEWGGVAFAPVLTIPLFEGAGKMIFVSDPSIFINRWTQKTDENDNLKFVTNLIDYATNHQNETTKMVLFDLGHSYQPLNSPTLYSMAVLKLLANVSMFPLLAPFAPWFMSAIASKLVPKKRRLKPMLLTKRRSEKGYSFFDQKLKQIKYNRRYYEALGLILRRLKRSFNSSELVKEYGEAKPASLAKFYAYTHPSRFNERTVRNRLVQIEKSITSPKDRKRLTEVLFRSHANYLKELHNLFISE